MFDPLLWLTCFLSFLGLLFFNILNVFYSISDVFAIWFEVVDVFVEQFFDISLNVKFSDINCN